MRVLHCCLASFYVENYNYQENVLPRMNKEAGHEVRILASTEVFIRANESGHIKSGSFVNEDEIQVIRVPYKRGIPLRINYKLRKYTNIYEEVSRFNPDIIFCHGIQFLDLKVIVKYVKRHNYVKLYVDCHSDFHNSAKGFLSKNILHRMIYLPVIKYAMPYIEKILYITYEVKEFLIDVYHLEQSKMEYYPLGGIVLPEEIRKSNRYKYRKSLNVKENDILLMHSGKIDAKKRTKELIEAVNLLNAPNIKLVIIGSIDEKYGETILPMIYKSRNIIYLGWKSGNELQEYLCACDLYMQPGSQSATMQNALCNGCAVCVTTVLSHKYLLGDNAFYADTKEEIFKILKFVSYNKEQLNIMKDKSLALAKEKLDYKILAEKIIRGF